MRSLCEIGVICVFCIWWRDKRKSKQKKIEQNTTRRNVRRSNDKKEPKMGSWEERMATRVNKLSMEWDRQRIGLMYFSANCY